MSYDLSFQICKTKVKKFELKVFKYQKIYIIIKCHFSHHLSDHLKSHFFSYIIECPCIEVIDILRQYNFKIKILFSKILKINVGILKNGLYQRFPKTVYAFNLSTNIDNAMCARNYAGTEKHSHVLHHKSKLLLRMKGTYTYPLGFRSGSTGIQS